MKLFKLSTERNLRADERTRNLKVKEGEAVEESERDELTGTDARKEVVSELTENLSEENRDKGLRELGFKQDKRKLIKEVAEGK